ncbi:MAG TPA: hypothetical protein DEP35_19015 [Deltaproteobacteria bacterium]|nr:hypothetical protein [Deltaproteobacteria bacterium]
MGFFDSLRGLFRSKKGSKPSGVRRGALPPRRPDVATQSLRTPGAPPSPPPPAAVPPFSPAAAATEMRPQPTLERPEPIVPPPAPPPAWAPSPGQFPPRAASPAPAAGQGETRYQAALSIRGKTVGVLVAVDGELEGEVFRVPDGDSRLGRSDGCEVRLPSEWISREHAKVKHQDGMFVIAPLSDKNPTFVNDERTEGTELKDGDFVKLGRTTFRFRTVF